METTISAVRAYCLNKRTGFTMHPDGSMWLGGIPVSTKELGQRVDAKSLDIGHQVELKPRQDAIYLQADGYADLALVLQRAFNQAAHGKGKERHAQGEPFSHQVMQDMARRFGVGALLGQAFKKSEESQRLPQERAVAELLGAINYLAGAVIALERQAAEADPVVKAVMLHAEQRNTPPAANDNMPCCAGGTQTLARCTGCEESSGLAAEALTRR